MLKVFTSFSDYKPWSGACSTYDRIEAAGLLDELEEMLEEAYPEGISETGINDLLWFDADYVFDYLGLRTEDAINAELDEARDELEALLEDFLDESTDMDDDEKSEYYLANYAEEADHLESRIEELEAELDEI